MKISITFIFLCLMLNTFSQSIPSTGENIDFLITSGKYSDKNVGDDDHQQVLYFLIPTTFENAFYLRVFDPETGGKHDEKHEKFDTKTEIKVYGGKGAHSASDARDISYVNDVSGSKLFEKTFNNELEYDDKWYTFGPLNPKDGELDPNFKGYVFKVVISGVSGNDVNLYRFAASTSKLENLDIPGANAFTYEYSIRLKSKKEEITHLYPYIDDGVVSIKQFNFDFDSDGKIRLFSVVKKGVEMSSSGNGNWVNSKHEIAKKEKGRCLDYQVIKKGSWHNDMVVYIVNQYNIPIPFFATPLGGVPEPEMKFKTIRQGDK